MKFRSRLNELKNFVDQYIQNYLNEMESRLQRPGLKELAHAISYSAREGGHRVRPVLSILAGEAFGKSKEDVIGLGAAVELIHTYSLIHDDLPCMDNDDFRRGKPSNHKAFGEAVAVLAGDALNTEAFLLLAKAYGSQPQLAVDLIAELAMSSGTDGMVGGQAVDVFFKDKEVGSAEIEFLHLYKTGALFRMSILGAARICGANAAELKALSDYARAFGLIFQISDDMADNKSQSDEPSFVKAVGMENARHTCEQLVLRAQAALAPFGDRARGLQEFVSYVWSRSTDSTTPSGAGTINANGASSALQKKEGLSFELSK